MHMPRTQIPRQRIPIASGTATETGRRPSVVENDVLDSLSTQIAVLDDNGVVVYANAAWRTAAAERVGGADRAVIGRNFLGECRRAEARGVDGARALRQAIEAVLARRMTRFRGDYRRHGEERWYEVIVDAVKHETGGVIVSVADVTERRRDESQAELRRRHVAHLGQMAMMTEIASALVHEIKLPVTAIRLNALAGATLLGSPRTAFDAVWSDSREAWQMFKDVYDDASRASGVIEHVQQHVRRQGTHGTIVDIGETCRTTARLLEYEATLRGARLELDVEADVPAVVGDAIEIQQIVMSLTMNGLDAVSASSKRVVTLGVAARGAEVELFVRDTGPGLSPSVRQHLFESFFTTKESGLGMGLMVVRSITERHRGRVSAEDSPDGRGGAIFRVHLPVS
ncbi:MAG TPA: ATP-binding protein [Gemmatimonadaceae bacterium]|jgi:PAS domain S-box-containing protein|nr:ATP-binding protein [Gemmatimonadaceae bacterium]